MPLQKAKTDQANQVHQKSFPVVSQTLPRCYSVRNIAGLRLRAEKESEGEEDNPKRNQRGKRRRRRVGMDLEDELARGRLGQEKQSMKILYLQVLFEARTRISQRISLGSNRKP